MAAAGRARPATRQEAADRMVRQEANSTPQSESRPAGAHPPAPFRIQNEIQLTDANIQNALLQACALFARPLCSNQPSRNHFALDEFKKPVAGIPPPLHLVPILVNFLLRGISRKCLARLFGHEFQYFRLPVPIALKSSLQ